MGPKPNKKAGKNIRPTLPNPFIENIPQIGTKELDTILSILVDKLKNIYPLPVSNKQVMDAIEAELPTDISFSTLTKGERKEKFRDKRKEIRHSSDSNLNVEFRKYISIGLKQCLKDLSTNNLSVLIIIPSKLL